MAWSFPQTSLQLPRAKKEACLKLSESPMFKLRKPQNDFETCRGWQLVPFQTWRRSWCPVDADIKRLDFCGQGTQWPTWFMPLETILSSFICSIQRLNAKLSGTDHELGLGTKKKAQTRLKTHVLWSTAEYLPVARRINEASWRSLKK